MSDPAQPRTPSPLPLTTAASHGLWLCRSCAAVCEAPADATHRPCPRCGARVSVRKPDATARCWALLLAATALYVPANLLPVTHTTSFFGEQSDTILSGIVYLWLDGSWPLAILVFFASIVVPLAKLVILSYLLISVQRHSRQAPQHRLRLYRTLEIIGRWSMLDVYVVTLLAALVQIQSLASITPGPGAVAFGSVVVLTMLATQCFDPRAIWDPLDPAAASQRPS